VNSITASAHFSQSCPSRSFFARPLQLITSHERRLETCILRKTSAVGLHSSRAANAFRPSISLKAEGQKAKKTYPPTPRGAKKVNRVFLNNV